MAEGSNHPYQIYSFYPIYQIYHIYPIYPTNPPPCLAPYEQNCQWPFCRPAGAAEVESEVTVS